MIYGTPYQLRQVCIVVQQKQKHTRPQTFSELIRFPQYLFFCLKMHHAMKIRATASLINIFPLALLLQCVCVASISLVNALSIIFHFLCKHQKNNPRIDTKNVLSCVVSCHDDISHQDYFCCHNCRRTKSHKEILFVFSYCLIQKE